MTDAVYLGTSKFLILLIGLIMKTGFLLANFWKGYYNHSWTTGLSFNLNHTLMIQDG